MIAKSKPNLINFSKGPNKGQAGSGPTITPINAFSCGAEQEAVMMTFKAITSETKPKSTPTNAHRRQPPTALLTTMCIQMQIAPRHTLRIRNAKCQRQERQQQCIFALREQNSFVLRLFLVAPRVQASFLRAALSRVVSGARGMWQTLAKTCNYNKCTGNYWACSSSVISQSSSSSPEMGKCERCNF